MLFSLSPSLFMTMVLLLRSIALCRSFTVRPLLLSSSSSSSAAAAAVLSAPALRMTTTDGSPAAATAAATTQEEVDPGVVVGTKLRIVKYPHPALRAYNVEITNEELTNGSIAQLAKEMFMVMYAANGVGLAAPQVGVNKRLMVYNESGDKTKWLDETILINPVIKEVSAGTDIEIEGCLSFPGMNGKVERNKWIKVEAFNLKGKKIKKKFIGWEARIFQHEYDHLDGVVYIDRLVEESKNDVKRRLEELVQEFDGEPAL